MSKIGQGAFQAWMRAGFKEVSQILQAFPDSIRPVEEPGLLGNLTPQEIAHQKDVYQQDLLPPAAAKEMKQEKSSRDVKEKEPELER